MNDHSNQRENSEGSKPSSPPASTPGGSSGEHFDATLPLGAGAQAGSGSAGEGTAGSLDEKTLHTPQATPMPAKGVSSNQSKKKRVLGAIGETFAKRFVLEELLGEGGMGRVYLARDQFVDGRAVALKVLHPKFSKHETFRSLFFREIKTAQKFVSENVNQVRDTGQTDDGTIFLTMDLVDGEDLDGLLKRESQVTVRHALDITIQILMGLQSGHEHGFVHRDVKPSNVMLANRITKVDENPFGVGVRLLDFGIAGLAADIEEGQLVGTPNYMSPEQVQGQRLDARSDLFAVGVVLYEMITGTRPFQGETIAQITSSILEKDLSPMIRDISDLSQPVQEILSKALEKNRDQRFQSAEEFVSAIKKSSAYRLPRLMPAWAGAALVILTLGGLASGYFHWGSIQENNKLTSELATVRFAGFKEGEELRDVHRQELNDLKRTIANQLNTINEMRDAQQNVVDTSQNDTTGDNKFLARIDVLKSKAAALESERNELQFMRELESAEHIAAVQVLENKIGKLEDKVGELGAFQVSNQPAALISETLDTKLTPFWEKRKGSMARQALSLLQDNQSVGNIAGVGVMNAITDLTVHLERSAANSGDDIFQRAARAESIAEMERLLPQVEDLSDFERQADNWLRYGEDESSPSQPSARLASISALLTGPDGLIKEARTVIASLNFSRDKRWNTITSGDALQSPAAVLAFADEHQDQGYLSSELNRFARGLRYRLVEQGAIDHEGLLALASLGEWETLLAQNPDLGSIQDRNEIALLRFAQRWYGDLQFIGTAQDVALFGDDPFGGVLDWQAALCMAHQMTLPDSAFPAQESGLLTYRLSRSDEDNVTWRIHTHKSRSQAGEDFQWNVGLISYREDGRESFGRGSFDYVRKGKIFRRQNKKVFNLDGNRRPVIQRIELATQPAPPAQVVKGFEMDEFRAELPSTGIPCLYQKDAAGIERWISPRLGLLREKDQAKGKVIELVYGSYAR